MNIFLTLLLKLIPLYVIIGLGFIARKHLKSDRQTIADLMLYMITPLVIFYGTIQAKISVAMLILPLVMFIICCSLGGIALLIGKKIWGGDPLKNIYAFAAGCGNSGYFGLPLTLILLGDQSFSIAVLASLGIVLYQHSLGFYIAAKGHHTSKEAFLRVLQLPTVYAFFIGLILNLLQVHLNDIMISSFELFKSTYSVLGMMIVGMGLAGIQKTSFDLKFILASFMSKFVVWPVVVGLIVWTDLAFFHIFSQEIHNVMLIMAIIPMAADTVVFSTKFNIHPEKASLTVMLSTLFTLVYIPIFTSLFIK